MNPSIKVGIIGDFDPANSSHMATNEAIDHAAEALSMGVEYFWLPTSMLAEETGEAQLNRCDALWAGSRGPYKMMAGGYRAIAFARKHGKPFLGT
ncbi:MAG: hypothetical protein KKF30_05455 [Proteobacteria bacterium]|nr:hypothetical protein [Pseudomonadota bacterium]MBU4472303.1 hypothetical protein [Pseudomonadota bacterium]MCG2751999.1 hypothetical protein [Desulfobacteraceae bacterium]